MSARALRERLQPWHGGAALVGLGLVYMLLALISGHEARAEPPEDLSAGADAALDVYRAAALVVNGARVVDVREAGDFERAHLPGAVSQPGADADELGAGAGQPLLVIGGRDEATRKLVAEARAATPKAEVHFLRGGMRPWFLTFDLPVALFSAKPPPHGYEAALGAVRGFLRAPSEPGRAAASEALQTLARLDYRPDLLGQAKKTKAAKKRKKISGGCG